MLRRCRDWAQSAAALLLVASQLAHAYTLNVNSSDSIKNISSQMAADMMSFYNGNQPGGTPGLLPQPYYWWEAGAMLGALVDYWYYTGDTTYNDITQAGLLFQVGPNNDYMPPNQTLTEGNDDQGFWGMSVMTAAEYNFQDPPSNQPQWLALAQAVFNTQAARWDTANCNGGLRWQIFTWNNGFDYKNSISQACFFNLAARLALYTGNASYAEWAVKTWDWTVGTGFMDKNYYIYDGGHIEQNCTEIVPYQFSYNAGAFLLGAAAMYAYTNQTNQSTAAAAWHTRVDGLLNGTSVFFTTNNNSDDQIMYEVACETVNLCDLDQQSFKAYLSRWMAATTKWAPWTYDRIKPLLETSAVAASAQCTGGNNGRMCGLKWVGNDGKWDGTTGVGQQMAAMEVVLANMIKQATPPVTNNTGGTSAGDPAAGGGGSDSNVTPYSYEAARTMTAADRAGAIVCTVVVGIVFFAALIWMVADENESPRENWNGLVTNIKGAPGAAAVLVRKRGPPEADEKGKGQAGAERSSSSVGEKFVEKTPEIAGHPMFAPPAPALLSNSPASSRVVSMSAASPAASDRSAMKPEGAKRSSLVKKQRFSM